MSGHIPIGADVQEYIDAGLGGGGGTITAIDITDTLATAANVYGPFDSRGLNALSLLTKLTEWVNDGTDSLNTYVLTRATGLPWMPCGVVEMSVGAPILSFPTLWPNLNRTQSGGGVGFVPTIWLDGYVGLLDETIIVVQPTGSGGTLATVDAGDAGVSYAAVILGDWANALVVDLVDPGAPDSPLGISSADGWTATISLETDGMGAIISNAGDIAALFSDAANAGNVANNFAITAVANTNDVIIPETLQLADGANDCAGVTYEIKGSYK